MVSVIVPVYNVEKYLIQCLDSILNQTYNDLEIIIIDDGSKDSSGRICDEYAERYDNIHAYHKLNEGLGMARNTGIKYAHGKYIVFLDSDDYLDKECISNLVDNMEKNNVDLCKGGYKRVYNDGTIKSLREYNNYFFDGSEAKDILFPRMIGSSPNKNDSIEMCVTGSLYNANIIIDNNLRFPSERELISEDLLFNMEYMQYANGACLIKQSAYNYRINTESLTTSYRKDRFIACKKFYRYTKKRLHELNYSNATIQRLDRIFFVYIRGCIAQECKNKSRKSSRECIRSIGEICSDQLVHSIIEKYPKKNMGKKQKIFLGLVYWKMKTILYLLSEIGV